MYLIDSECVIGMSGMPMLDDLLISLSRGLYVFDYHCSTLCGSMLLYLFGAIRLRA